MSLNANKQASIPHSLEGNRIVSHAGGGLSFAPNSLEGIEWALTLEPERIEVDVQRTCDDAFVLYHDATVPLPSGKAFVGNVSASELARFGTPGRELVTLDRVCALVAPTATNLVLDLKADRSGGANTPLIEAALAAVRRHGLENRAAFHSDSVDLLRELLAGAPGSLTGAAIGSDSRSFDQNALEAELINFQHLGIKEAQFYASDPAYAPVASFADLIDKAYALDLVPGVWTVNDASVIAEWLNSSIRFIATDNPDQAIALLAKNK